MANEQFLHVQGEGPLSWPLTGGFDGLSPPASPPTAALPPELQQAARDLLSNSGMPMGMVHDSMQPQAQQPNGGPRSPARPLGMGTVGLPGRGGRGGHLYTSRLHLLLAIVCRPCTHLHAPTTFCQKGRKQSCWVSRAGGRGARRSSPGTGGRAGAAAPSAPTLKPATAAPAAAAALTAPSSPQPPSLTDLFPPHGSSSQPPQAWQPGEVLPDQAGIAASFGIQLAPGFAFHAAVPRQQQPSAAAAVARPPAPALRPPSLPTPAPAAAAGVVPFSAPSGPSQFVMLWQWATFQSMEIQV